MQFIRFGHLLSSIKNKIDIDSLIWILTTGFWDDIGV